MTTEPVVRWAVVRPNGNVQFHSMRRLRTDAIKTFVNWTTPDLIKHEWQHLKYYGYTCRKVRVSVVEAGE